MKKPKDTETSYDHADRNLHRDAINELNALVKEELIYQANLKGSLDKAIASYQENNRFFSYLINLPKTLESFATAIDIVFSAQYKSYDKKIVDVVEKCFVDGPPLQHRVRHSDNLCFAIWTQYKKNSVLDVVNEIYKLYKEYGEVKLSLVEVIRQLFCKERKMIIRAIVARDLAVTLKSEEFTGSALQELKNKIQKDRDKIIDLFGEECVVFPAMKKEGLKPEDFIGEASIRNKIMLKKLTGDRASRAKVVLHNLVVVDKK